MVGTEEKQIAVGAKSSEEDGLVEEGIRREAPSFKSVPESAPSIGSKKGSPIMIVPWCC